jgi:RNA polymerase sigma factor (sigma-70 family)
MNQDKPVLSLLDRACRSDQHAIAAIVNRYEGKLQGIARRLLLPQVRSVCDPEDISQMVWIEFFTPQLLRKTFLTAESVAAYLCKITKRQITRAYRTFLRKRSREQHEDARVVVRLPDAHPSPDQQAEANDLRARALDAVPAEMRGGIGDLLDGANHREVAQVLGTSRSSVRRIIGALRHAYLRFTPSAARPGEPAPTGY